MTKDIIGGECHKCRHRVGLECRRNPQVVTRMVTADDYRYAEWGFPPAGLSCSEYKEYVRHTVFKPPVSDLNKKPAGGAP